MKNWIITFAISLLFLILAQNTYAQNNKFGIHIIDENDLPRAAELVNSQGGSWGYVTVVIREDQRDTARWQRVFDQMRRLKLIPLVRIATKMDEAEWRAPSPEDALAWSQFFESLNWVIKRRYIILFNEPNHAKEWGGKIAPDEYAAVVQAFHDELKAASPDYYLLPGALDLAAGNTKNTMDARDYYLKMYSAVPEVFELFDGWASHSYANPDFSGESTDSGRMSIRGYQWELEFLKDFGVPSDTEIFITETGKRFTGENLSDFYVDAYENAWNDDRVVAVTPFLLNYQDYPFDEFSWVDPINGVPRDHYLAVKNVSKVKGAPIQEHSYELIGSTIPSELISDSHYSFSIELKNTGQSIWSEADGFYLAAQSVFDNEVIKTGRIPETLPGESVVIPVRIKTNGVTGVHAINFSLLYKTAQIGSQITSMISTIEPPTLKILAQPWYGKEATNDNFTLSFFDQEELIMTIPEVLLVDGMGEVKSLRNIIPGKEYSITLNQPFHKTSERKTIIHRGQNQINFGRLLPLDLNNDGEVNIEDVITHWNSPLHTTVKLLPI